MAPVQNLKNEGVKFSDFAPSPPPSYNLSGPVQGFNSSPTTSRPASAVATRVRSDSRPSSGENSGNFSENSQLIDGKLTKKAPPSSSANREKNITRTLRTSNITSSRTHKDPGESVVDGINRLLSKQWDTADDFISEIFHTFFSNQNSFSEKCRTYAVARW